MKEIFRNIWAVIKRELKQMFARPLYMFASVGVMVLSTFFFLTLMRSGSAENMPVAVVDKDQSSISRRLIHEMQATPSIDIQLVTNSYPEAREAMQQGKIYGIFVIREGFYRDLVAFKRPQLDFYITNAYTVGGNTAYKQMLTMVNLTSGAFQREVLRKKGLPDDVIMHRIQPLTIEGHMIANPWGNYSVYLVSTILPGILGLICMMVTIFAIGFELKMKTSHAWLHTARGLSDIRQPGPSDVRSAALLVLHGSPWRIDDQLAANAPRRPFNRRFIRDVRLLALGFHVPADEHAGASKSIELLRAATALLPDLCE